MSAVDDDAEGMRYVIRYDATGERVEVDVNGVRYVRADAFPPDAVLAALIECARALGGLDAIRARDSRYALLAAIDDAVVNGWRP